MKTLFTSVIYENPLPQLRARQSAFPGLCRLPDGRILATHQMGEAFESVDGTTYISISEDAGKTWSAPRRVFDKESEQIPLTDNSKPTLLPDGRVALFGYQYFRPDPELPIGNPETGGLLEDEIFLSLSEDMGQSFGERVHVPCAWGYSAEASAPLYVLQDGSWATPITGFARWDGTPSGRNCGRLLRSFDGGKSWNDDVICTAFEGDKISCFEQRMCQLDDGTLVVISWNENMETGERHNNHVTISTDNGKSFGAPIDTGVLGQASSLLSLGGNRVLALHAVRRDTDAPGIYADIAEVKDGKWNILSLERIWAPATPVVKDPKMAEIFSFLKFGQPSAIRLADGTLLMTHWEAKDGVYRTLATGLSLE